MGGRTERAKDAETASLRLALPVSEDLHPAEAITKNAGCVCERQTLDMGSVNAHLWMASLRHQQILFS